MTTATSTEALLALDTANDGFAVLEALASRADADEGSVVHLTTASLTVLGTTIGLIDYVSRLGLDTTRLQEDYILSGPLRKPQHLHLADVEVTTRLARTHFRPLHRVRIYEVRHCVIRT